MRRDIFMDERSLLKKLTALDFMSYDIGLYLDTHPNDREMFRKYCEIVEESRELRKRYEEAYNSVTSFRMVSGAGKEWLSGGWPWEEEYNFSLRGERQNVGL